MKTLDKIYINCANRLKAGIYNFLHDENGDTNFISIIIVLGIVLALVVIFRGYIKDILDKISGNITKFKNTNLSDF